MDHIPDKPLLIYDGGCGFCKIWVRYCQSRTGDAVTYAPFQDFGDEYSGITREQFKRSVWLVFPNGERFGGAAAVFRLLGLAGKTSMLAAYRNAPGFSFVAEAAYRFIADHRNLFYWLTRFLWGKEVVRESYALSRSIFLRGLAVVYLIAFVSLIPQITGLIGAQGIAPVGIYIGAVREQIGLGGFWYVPTLAWLNSSDAFLRTMCWAGSAFAIALLFRVAPLFSLAALWALYLSVVAAGQDFLSFQWDALLLEVGFAALLLAPFGLRPSYRIPPLSISVWVMRVLLFRLMFESGLVKLLSGDPNWRSLNALRFHYETQPLPTVFAWYAHPLPDAFQRASVFGVFVVELVVPFLFFAPRRPRILAAWITIGFQAMIALTGNYAFFNLLTILLCVLLLDDHHLRRFSASPAMPQQSKPALAALVVGIALIALGLIQVITMLAGFRQIPAPIAWLDEQAEAARVVNHYGLFAVMTTSREEIVIEGSDDSLNWKPYEFKFKPQDVAQRPRWVAPYQPRLDWQMWFAALSNAQQTPWFSNLMFRLLQGSPAVLPLLKTNPFPDHPPKFLRAVQYEYHFTTSAERRLTGAWWTRRYGRTYFPAVSLPR